MPRWNFWLKMAIFVIAALAVRSFIAFSARTISSDGPEYIYVAQLFANGDLQTALSHNYHPIYPATIAFFNMVLGSWELSAVLPCILFSSFAVIFIYLIALRLFDEKVAVIASVIYCVVPYPTIFSSQILTTGMFIFFFVLTFYLIILAFQSNKWYFYSAASLAGLMSYLVRPDGLIILGAMVLTIVLVNIRDFSNSHKKMLLGLAGVLAPLVILLAIYLAASGKSIDSLIPKKIPMSSIKDDVSTLPEFLSHAETPHYYGDETYLWVLIKVFNIFIGTCPHIIFGFLVFGMYKRRIYRYAQGPELTALFVFIGYWLMMSVFVMFFTGYVSRRHFAPLVALYMPWAAAGLLELVRRASIAANRLRITNKDFSASNYAIYGLLTAVMIVFVVKIAPPMNTEKIGERKAGEWLAQQFPNKKLRVLTNMNRVSYYAGAYDYMMGYAYNLTSIPYDEKSQTIPYANIIEHIKKQDIDIIVVDDNSLEKTSPEFMKKQSAASDLILLKSFTKTDFEDMHSNTIYIFQPAR